MPWTNYSGSSGDIGPLNTAMQQLFGAADWLKTPDYTGSGWKLQVDATGNFTPAVNNAAALGSTSLRWTAVYATQLSDGADQLVGSAGTVVRMGFGPSWTAVALGTGATERARVVPSGLLVGRTAQASGGALEVQGNIVAIPSGSAPTLANNGEMSFQLVSNTSLKILVRGSDGVTRSTTLTLS